MTAIELKLELARQVLDIPDNEDVITKAIAYIKKLTQSHAKANTLTGEALRMWNRTMEFEGLVFGWDGEGGLPIEKKAIGNVRKMLKACDGNVLDHWLLFPDTNGTLLLQYNGTDKDASISIGNTAYSYFVDKNDQPVDSAENVKFSVASLIQTINHINQQ
jgi:hypothetical protein